MKKIILLTIIILLSACAVKKPEISNNSLPLPADGSIVNISQFVTPIENTEGYNITYMSDGLSITGYIIKPTGDGPFPAIIYNHGSINGVAEPDALYTLARLRYVVVASNYRGNGGSQGVEDFGDEDVNDVLNIITAAKNLKYVNINKICMLGESHGGQMSLLALSRTGDIKAAVVLFPITDLISLASYYESINPDNYLLNLLERKVGGSIKSMPEEYKKRSPINFIGQINTPLLILHGEDDKTVPIDQSYKLADELKKFDKKFITRYYKNQIHGFTGEADIDLKIFISEWLQENLK